MSKFTLPELPYSYDALDPYMSAETLEFHHDKHHQAYVDKGNKMIEGSGLENATLEEAMISSFKDPKQGGLFNQLGQHYNHIHFWQWMKPNGGGQKMLGSLESKIAEDIGSYDDFRKSFIEQGTGQFGSGWVWLAQDSASGKLEVLNSPNGENPLVYGKTPILGCDVWEHSYYIDYRNAREKYLNAFLDNLVNWDYVGELFEKGPLEMAA